ncbi:extracellular catalytic domain type 1 short-chain-length polyhydroxyalkanoate depolymerase [Mesorhizobium sp. 113-3-3]|uniref:extracellular catalytic domain type 1 short-chain-length polyhydroxyalkanoate depolymerase n=1 Tax=Mesorhizobium sp. 113-3-3 TaxID=2744516 RepID=UPI0019278495|nr:PHB depolymerase family esterase [Mesorhizobium sp. 113-3-3]BCG78924.1 LpqC, poly [Mesorhizobium sp. 113-3-3]
MRNISDTIARLSAMRGGTAFYPQGHLDSLSDLAEFGSNPGALRARFYVPENLPRGAALVVVLHGCTQTAASYDHGSGWSRLAAEEGFAVLFPEQQRANNANLCFNWFVPEDVTRDRGEALSIRQMIEAMVTTHGLDRRRIFITGLSAGGAMAAAMLATYPDVFAGGAILAGLAYGSASTIPEAFDRMRGHGGPSKSELQRRLAQASSHKGNWPKISIWQGTADRTVAPSNADALVAQWQGVHRAGAGHGRTEAVDGQTRQVWCDVDGNEVIEKYTIAGMGHGAPLKTAGEDGLGHAAPFMLDVGISSTRRIAAFWNIAGRGARGEPQPAAGAANPAAGTALDTYIATEKSRPARVEPAGQPPPDGSRASPVGIGKTIEDALRAAGLMR